MNLREARAPRTELLADFHIRLLDVVGEFAPPTDDGDLDRFMRSLRGYRAIATDARQEDALPRAAEACVAECIAHF